MQQRAVNAVFFTRFLPIWSQKFVAIPYVRDSPRIFRNKRLDDKNPEIIRDPRFARVSLILALVLFSCTTSCVYCMYLFLDRTWCHVHTSSSDKNRWRGWRTFCPSAEGFVHGLTSDPVDLPRWKMTFYSFFIDIYSVRKPGILYLWLRNIYYGWSLCNMRCHEAGWTY